MNNYEWSARGSNCPICHKDFRYGCNHTIEQAYKRLEENRINRMIDKRLKKLMKQNTNK